MLRVKVAQTTPAILQVLAQSTAGPGQRSEPLMLEARPAAPPCPPPSGHSLAPWHFSPPPTHTPRAAWSTVSSKNRPLNLCGGRSLSVSHFLHGVVTGDVHQAIPHSCHLAPTHPPALARVAWTTPAILEVLERSRTWTRSEPLMCETPHPARSALP